MISAVSRVFSVMVVAAALWVAWPVHSEIWYVVLGIVPSLIFIWFPEEVDEYTFGTWQKGYRIDAHTPRVMIVVVGWVLLLLFASALLAPDFLARLFGAL